MFIIEDVKPGSLLLVEVRQLWRTHSATLGFFPDGAFDEYARDGGIIAATDKSSNELMGYICFRTTQRRQAAIVHLCVNQKFMKNGIARGLFENMRARQVVQQCDEITVRCRRDFEANEIWPKLGFVAVDEFTGKNEQKRTVTRWRYEIRTMPLFANIERKDNLVKVAIDANVFFDLYDNDEIRVSREESKALMADWLQQFIDLRLTDEIFNEINRHKNINKRRVMREKVAQIGYFPCERTRARDVYIRLRNLIKLSDNDNSNSDRWHIAKSVAGGVQVYVTRDEDVLEQGALIYDEFSINVMRPCELIVRFGELQQEGSYRPSSLAGSAARTEPVRPDNINTVADFFFEGNGRRSSRRRDFIVFLRNSIAQSDKFICKRITDRTDRVLAAYVLDLSCGDRVKIPALHIASGAIGRAVLRHVLESIILESSCRNRIVVELSDPDLQPGLDIDLQDLHFVQQENRWIRLTLDMIGTRFEIAETLSRATAAISPVLPIVSNLIEALKLDVTSKEDLYLAERMLWPVKIRDLDLPCFIIPIKPRWASQLFDRELAGELLFGALPQLILNTENAYYRSARPNCFEVPGRIIWYVSQDRHFSRTMMIKGCSYLDEFLVDKPKAVFRRFRRLGVYDWADVFRTAEQDLSKSIMGIRFSGTQIMHSGLEWSELQEILTTFLGNKNQIQSPLRISEECYLEIYGRGRRTH